MLTKLACAVCLALTLAAQVIYRNPVIDGDFPDPSIVRSDTTGEAQYWSATTGGEKATGAFPLFYSSDLVHWTRAKLGFVFPNPPAWTTGDYWAPEISEYHHIYYVFYSAFCDVSNASCQAKMLDKRNPHCVGFATAQSPGGPYTDGGEPLVCGEWGAIDPAVFWDSEGQYLLWKQDSNACVCGMPSRIWMQQFSIREGQAPEITLVGKVTMLIESNNRSWEDSTVEGPFLLKRKDLYYLFYSGALYGGVDKCNYALGVARASTVLGPYVKDPSNPILSTNVSWKCPGHGSVVTLPDEQTFFLHHAFPRKPEERNQRNVVLDEIVWKPDGWPLINDYQGVSAEGSVPR